MLYRDGNTLFSYLCIHAFIKVVNLAPYICPAQQESLEVLFERKIPKPDGTPLMSTSSMST